MTEGIKIGMSFSSYDGMIKELKESCNTEKKEYSAETDYESEYLFTDKDTGEFKNGYRENIRRNDNGGSLFSDAVIFNGEYQYGTSGKNKKDLNNFDYIQGKSQFALDFNGNNKVDEGEIFEGKIDYFIYKKAKEKGALAQYSELLNQFRY